MMGARALSNLVCCNDSLILENMLRKEVQQKMFQTLLKDSFLVKFEVSFFYFNLCNNADPKNMQILVDQCEVMTSLSMNIDAKLSEARFIEQFLKALNSIFLWGN